MNEEYIYYTTIINFKVKPGHSPESISSWTKVTNAKKKVAKKKVQLVTPLAPKEVWL